MEGYQTQVREQARPPYHRTASRSSTSTRMTTQSANSSTSHVSSSPQLHSAHPAHRYHHTSCARPPTSPRPNSRPTPQLSREGSTESARQTPVSSFLQEKLQKERQAESQKQIGTASTPRSNSDMSASFELGGAAQKSPVKNGSVDSNRPQSSSGDPKKGLGLKEMEQVVSGLHKQNFDLKLELYHRRERQTMMEERMESLETEKAQVGEMNDKLLGEMEKRDKAVEEAVGMIVMLEAKIDELTKERNMVRNLEAQGYYSSPGYEPSTDNHSPRTNTLDAAQLEGDSKSLNRMPSFVSERSEKTENLRNVYLGARGSVLSLPRVSEGASEADNGHASGLASPTLSVLSESSFVSVYGQKGEKMTPSKVDEPLSLDGGASKTGAHEAKATHRAEAPNQIPRSNSFSRSNNGGQFQPIASVMGGSPLQRIERLDPAYSQKKEAQRPSSSGKALGPSETGKPPRSPGRKATREEKREALRKVMTDTPGGVSLHEQALPPTPDTVASSTLRRFKNSNDTLDRRHDGMEGRSQDSLPHLSNSHEKLPEPLPTVPSTAKPHPPQHTKLETSGDTPRRSQQPAQRPRSADESTVSHRNGCAWDLDYDDSDTDSFESSLDIWLRAGSRPTRKGRASPDLFGFPTQPSNGSWALNAMFGPHNPHSGGARINPDSDQMHDLFSAQQALFGSEGAPPPPPHRRSSLNAQTGPNMAPADDATPKPPPKVKNQKPPGRRARHFRRNSDDAQMRANMKTPVPGQFAQPPQQPPNGEQKRNHYPPIAGHQGARNGLRQLFRRSLGGAPAIPAPEHPAPPNAEPANADPPKSTQQPAPPSWVNRNGGLDDDRSGATPPPILRNPRQGRGSVSELEPHGPCTPGMDGVPTTPVTAIAKGAQAPSPVTQEPPESAPAAGSATGTRRKWLPAFGRSSSLKNKSG